MKHTFRIQLSLAFVLLFAFWLNSCSKEGTDKAAAPINEVDVMLNNYEKVTNQYVRAARKLKGGDMSVTIPYIELGKETRKYAAQLQPKIGQMTPQQAQRVATISAKAATYLQN